MPRVVLLLSLCQALLVSGNILLIAVSPLIGSQLAPSPMWSTAPVATQWLGLMCATIPASLIMGRLGRRLGFMLGNVLGLCGACLAMVALQTQQFALFLASTWLIGIGIGFGQLYRFAAVEAAPDGKRDRAIGLVMGGGVLAAFFGPWLARNSQTLADTPYLGSFFGLSLLYLLALILLKWVHIAPAAPHHNATSSKRSLYKIMRQPSFILAATSAMVGYGVMNLAMTATPIAMASSGHHFNQVATTIQWHVVAMFLPSFVTGRLTARFGPVFMIITGCLLLAASVAVAQLQISYAHFVIGLILLGLGWNFTFLPATGLLTETHEPSEKAHTQAANEFLVFSTVAITALAAGPLVNAVGWSALNAALLPLCLLPPLTLTWRKLSLRRQHAQRDV
ncbi:MFS transporter [Halomonas halocynthiae]|uniref:MFS transporter n=1 Tax=Halomonas halocynthiae TaxID=176290 RepID=UPI00040945D7|nr:MFS transporter [Halomonas halocynthiae]